MPAWSSSPIDPAIGHLAALAEDAEDGPPGLLAVLADEVAYYLCAAPAGTADDDLIHVAGSRWVIEECFQTAKTETGLDQCQVRRYDAWYRHITLAMLAPAYLAVTAAATPKALAAASSQARSARSAVSWHT